MILKTINKEEYIEATCDICGNDCMKPIYNPNISDGDRDSHDIIKSFEGLELNATWGYGSGKDGEQWSAVVCEDCVDKHLSKLITFFIEAYI